MSKEQTKLPIYLKILFSAWIWFAFLCSATWFWMLALYFVKTINEPILLWFLFSLCIISGFISMTFASKYFSLGIIFARADKNNEVYIIMENACAEDEAGVYEPPDPGRWVRKFVYKLRPKETGTSGQAIQRGGKCSDYGTRKKLYLKDLPLIYAYSFLGKPVYILKCSARPAGSPRRSFFSGYMLVLAPRKI